MIQLLIDQATPRVQYAADLLFGRLLGVDWRFGFSRETADGATLKVDYRCTPDAALPVRWHNSGLLLEDRLSAVQAEEIERLIATWEPGEAILDVYPDPLTLLFFLATEYERWVNPKYDRHGRIDERSFPILQKIKHWPVGHILAEEVRTQLLRHAPGLRLPALPRTVEFTLDIDFPWKYRHKGIAVPAGGLTKRLLTGHFSDLREQIATLAGGKDPYDTFEELYDLFPPQNTRFFFLIERDSSFDSRFTHRTPALRQLIRQIAERGYQLGVHPSYTSFLSPAKIAHEADLLREITGQPIVRSRQHFLRHRYPFTFRALLRAGIRHDYSLGMYHDWGFRTGLAIPYPWFDLGRNEVTDLTLHPTHYMDRSLPHYRNLSPQQAQSEFSQLLGRWRNYGGKLTLLFHNDAFSESGEWRGWGAMHRRWVHELR